MNIRYRVTLSSDERSQLLALIAGGKAAVRTVKRAQILLATAAGSTDETIVANVGVGTATVYRTKERFVRGGLTRALTEAPRPKPPRKLGVEDEAMLIASGECHDRCRLSLQAEDDPSLKWSRRPLPTAVERLGAGSDGAAAGRPRRRGPACPPSP